MNNPDLDRRYADCSELIDAWKTYLDYYNKAAKDKEFQPTPEIEQNFLDSKARIAMLHDSFMGSLKHDQNVGQNMLSIVNRSITLRHLKRLGAADLKKIEIEWHECYLLLNETTSQLSEDRERLADVNEFTYRLGRIQESIFLSIKAFLGSIYFKIIIALVIVGGIAGVLLTTVITPLRDMKAVGEPYSAFLDFRRDTLGIDAPYGSVDSIVEGKLAEIPSGFSMETQRDANKEDITSSFRDMGLNVDGEDAASYLDQCDGFKALRFEQPGGKPSVTAYLFYWFEEGPSKTFSYAFEAFSRSDNINANYLAKNFTIFPDNNILVVLYGPGVENQQPVKDKVFGK